MWKRQKLAKYFRGSGSGGSEAAVKILFGYDLKSHHFFYHLQDGIAHDQMHQEDYLQQLDAGDLPRNAVVRFKTMFGSPRSVKSVVFRQPSISRSWPCSDWPLSLNTPKALPKFYRTARRLSCDNASKAKVTNEYILWLCWQKFSWLSLTHMPPAPFS
ncbi:MAG: hypothetical protein ONB46_22145 [candidate division KSB1 bacterium]|nr:hypothetical protein [candidate division KSB1 bacterium]MDZ7367732.1 hypothetical protein [candidate division KSB1 bacterium]MDZ7406302.1 hypothetical protein [candidate division KSB1 bacterium]